MFTVTEETGQPLHHTCSSFDLAAVFDSGTSVTGGGVLYSKAGTTSSHCQRAGVGRHPGLGGMVEKNTPATLVTFLAIMAGTNQQCGKGYFSPC